MEFAQVETRFKELKRKYDDGALSEEDFKSQLEELMIQDEEGKWWIIGYETGMWHYHNGEKWVRGERPRPRTTMPTAPPRKWGKWVWLIVPIIVIIVAVIYHLQSTPPSIPVEVTKTVPVEVTKIVEVTPTPMPPTPTFTPTSVPPMLTNTPITTPVPPTPTSVLPTSTPVLATPTPVVIVVTATSVPATATRIPPTSTPIPSPTVMSLAQADALNTQAEQFYNQGTSQSMAQAMDIWHQIVDARPDHVKALYHLAGGYLGLGQTDQAISYGETAAVYDPFCINTCYILAAAYETKGWSSSACGMWQKITGLNYEDSPNHASRSYTEDLKNNAWTKLQNCSTTEGMSLTQADALNTQAEQLYNQGTSQSMAQAMDIWHQIVDARPDHVKALYHLAGGYLGLGQTDQAISYGETAAVYDPFCINTCYILAAAYETKGWSSSACGMWQKITGLNYEDSPNHASRSYTEDLKNKAWAKLQNCSP